MPDEALAVHESDVEGVRLIEVFGELDLATAPRLCAKLDAARAQRVRRVVVDLTGVDFCDSTGLRALMGASTELRHAGGKLAVAVLPDGGVARLFDVTGIREALPTHDTQASALASLTVLPAGDA
jgi:anti-sigma B factor antagonist